MALECEALALALALHYVALALALSTSGLGLGLVLLGLGLGLDTVGLVNITGRQRTCLPRVDILTRGTIEMVRGTSLLPEK